MKDISLSDLDYLTAKMVSTLRKHNIHTVQDLFLSFPTKFNDYTIRHLKDVVPNTNVTVAGVVQTKATVKTVRQKLVILSFYCDIDGRRIRVSIFNRQYLRTKIHYGVYVRLTGKLNENLKSFTASEIYFDELSNNISPVFNIKGISDNKMLEIKEKVFENYGDELIDILPNDIREKHQLISYQNAIKYINIPEDNDEIAQAIYRIKFEELFLYQLKIKYLLYMRKNHPQGIAINYNRNKVASFISRLPFQLTTDQNQVLQEILNDIAAPYQMNRLLQGEVGSGKTVVAAICLYAVITAGYQGAIMAPTEVLVQQHYQTFLQLFANEPIRIEMLSSSVNQKDKQVIIDGLYEKDIDIIVGTHALFQKDVAFERLGLVITDEEHRFGVRQRVSIVGKGHLIDHLKMSATPIPRTLAISVLGESDISVIKTLPGNKKEPITKYLSYDNIAEVLNHLRKIIDKGQQAYVICPMIDESEVMDLQNASEVYEKFKIHFHGVCEIGLIHSKLKPAEKEHVMSNFAQNKIQILVSTSVIEVGVNVINATFIVVLDADRFGIAQLHQMRGRVRRSDEQSYCYLISDSTAQTSIDRLQLVADITDGFILAEEDLLMRGPGDFFGEKQTGNVIFKMADLVLDKDILNEVNDLADYVIASGYLFNNPEYKKLLDIVHENYITKKDMLN
ncbi:MAG: ATP-dependent DNA helicase RecG [Bacilli bacterium]|nr:ATP-dependent DNA helicase RecG [Bacilli bacterium]MDD4076791.1 ATP-dependent DNA helicase RecG [Bacilli bacterium]MDD4388027.1 ATP-dependent DNA helicase RecG [Bacilli bacterium]